MYKLLKGGGIFRAIDGVSIPPDPANNDYAEYLAWIAAGNIPDPADVLNPKIAIQAQIDSLEREQLLPRVSREGLLLTMETFGAMQGITPAQLYLTNVAYHKVKDFDTQIALMRAQI
jgi:hypothetical protein